MSLLSIDDLTAESVQSLLEEAKAFVELNERPIKKTPVLRGRTVINMFFEASTRTRSSFEIAGKRLGADVINFAASSSSAAKGESALETARTLQAMRPDCVVVRHGSSGVPHQFARELGMTIINAGDGTNEHPTQALLDAYTLQNRIGSLQGKTVAIVGDIVRSRVARSNTKLLQMLGANVRWVAPLSLLPLESCWGNVQVFTSIDAGIDNVDAIMTLRIQHERGGAAGPFITDIDDYSRSFGVNIRRFTQFAPNAVVLHPGPANIGVELGRELIDHPQSLMVDQVTAGVGVRMAVLYRTIESGQASSQSKKQSKTQ